MSDEIFIDGMPFISSKRASELSGYTQDYIGQLSRSGQIKVRRVGGLWYVFMDSLLKYKEQADAYTPELPVRELGGEPESMISFDGKSYISTAKAAKITGYTADYVGQLARAGSISARQIGNRWYVERERILQHKADKDALLAAVQVESVGIKRPEEDKTLVGVDYEGAGPFFEYTKDEANLIPSIFKGRTQGVQETFQEETRQEIRDPSADQYAIPIRILGHQGPRALSRTKEGESRPLGHHVRVIRKPWRTYPLIAMTIVVVLSAGFVSLKNSSVYTQNSPKNGGAIQTAAAGSALDTEKETDLRTGTVFDRAGGFLEQSLVPEIVFKRGK